MEKEDDEVLALDLVLVPALLTEKEALVLGLFFCPNNFLKLKISQGLPLTISSTL
jgi:hypothetical protein